MLRLAVIGAGGRGRLARLAHQPDQGAALVAACDTDDAVLADCRQRYGPDFFVTRDYREIVSRDGIDGIFICSPDFLHEEHGVAALNAGRGVYLEKPMAITIDGCDNLLRAAGRSGARLYVGHNMRFFPVMRTMKQVIDSGQIGQVQAIWCRHFIGYGGDAYFKDWHSERKYSTGLLLQKGAHDIDMIHWFAGAHTRRVVAMGRLSVYDRCARRGPDEPGDATWDRSHWPPLSQKGFSPIIDVEDHSMVLMQLENGVQASYLQCHYTPDNHRNYTIIGTEGRIENCGDAPKRDQWCTVRLWTFRCGYQEEGTEMIKIPSIEGGHGGADPQIVADFLQFLRTGASNGARPIDARMSVATGYTATESLRNNNMPMDIPVFDAE